MRNSVCPLGIANCFYLVEGDLFDTLSIAHHAKLLKICFNISNTQSWLQINTKNSYNFKIDDKLNKFVLKINNFPRKL